MMDGLLMRGRKLVAPLAPRDKLVKSAHASHMGIAKTKKRMREAYWWPAMDVHVERLVCECTECACCDTIFKCLTQPMVIREQAPGLWTDISIDILGPVKLKTWDRYLIVCIDMFSVGLMSRWLIPLSLV